MSDPAGTPETQETAPTRTIADLTYRSYDGPLKTHAVRWWYVALATIRANVNRSRYWYWLPAGFITLVYLIHTAYFYFDRGIREGIATMSATGVPTDSRGNPFAAELYDTMSYPLVGLLIFVAALIVGASSIAADNRSNALLVYLSRPITRFDYLFGKWAGIFLLIASLTLIPSLLMFLFFIGSYGGVDFLRENSTLILRLLVAGLVPALIHSSLIVGFSAWSRSGRIAGATYAGLYLATFFIAYAVGNILWGTDIKGERIERTSIVLHSSVNGIKDGLAQQVYQVEPPPPIMWDVNGSRRRGRRSRRPRWANRKPEKLPVRPPLWVSLAMSGTIVVIPLALATAKVRAVEVVRG